MDAPVLHAGAAPSYDSAIGRGDVIAARIDRLIVAIDAALAAQVNAILNAPRFREMEGRWHALARLLDQIDSEQVTLRLLDVNWRVLSRDLERAVEFDQSHLYRLVYDGEFGMPGGLPFGLIVADYHVSARTDPERGDQVDTLQSLAGVAAAAFCPVILGTAPDLLGVNRFDELRATSDLAELRLGRHTERDLRRWTTLRQREDSRFLGIVAPDLVLRSPYRRYDAERADQFTFDEGPENPLFVNAAFAFASTVIATFQESGWFAAIRGAYQDEEGGGRVPAFGSYDFETDGHGISAQAPVRIRFTAAQENALIERGIVPLSALFLEPQAVFNANPSVHQPPTYETPVANENARLGAMLQYVLCTSRFAHYLKVMMRDEIGSAADPATIEYRLNSWLREYCLGNDDAAASLKAQYPLRDAGVTVNAVPGKPGCYAATIRLQPHFQLDDIATTFHLISEAPRAADLEKGVS
ncbi:type VI secretion system contractile sheath large subunit [Thalassococcus sp. S3]|uniref:type VI secretion system contractile sheath large subunit n=1 Tax=Thalassococcus sp. S3 TaxID=2017482 RepID=UPI00102426D3|nr:type VI secretion system contractile sheath large subunit [Thalassococcus sp. S3]QBF32473.1 type VI secretion protein [Thalassococcus sp. S3]